MIAHNKNIQIQNTTKKVTVPNDPLSRLRYFMDCMVTVVPNLNQYH